jgi:hypothetical protein
MGGRSVMKGLKCNEFTDDTVWVNVWQTDNGRLIEVVACKRF